MGAIIIFPPVNLLLLKVRNRQGRRSHSLCAVEAMRKGAVLELGEARENAKNVSEFAPALEAAIGEFADVGGKAKAQQIQKVNFAAPRAAAESRRKSGDAPCFQSFDRVFDAARGEIPQKRISGAQRKKAEGGPAGS